ncbi:LOW QUALITY PROTEIN: serine protease FAM111A [Mauremys reevesii]|uniref:LOW QUALITY PROTEIN: serine protease FAM111A n=1 Tax=Mauremys reevesii TaxID=260615 RepID=UPI00193F3EFE|nr:LOW QUALITY PROTEIN: serine protease FAM111A [Mauremys reevesii]
MSARKPPIGRSPASSTEKPTIPYCSPQETVKGSNPPTPKSMRSNTGANALKDIGSTPTSTEKPGAQDPESIASEDRKFTINLGKNGVEYLVKGKANDSIYRALMALKDIQTHIKKQQGKEMHLQGKREIKGFVNLGMPLKCLPQKSHFEMKFYKVKGDQGGGEQRYRPLDSTGTECVVFYIAPIGKKGPDGAQIQKIMRQEFIKERCKICVFAPKGETIKNALCKDGRFLPLLEEKEWYLVENSETLYNSHYSVDDLDSRSFEVQVVSERAVKARNEQRGGATRERQGEAFYQFKSALLDQYPELKNQSELIKEFFEEEVTESGKHVKALLELHRKNFSKEAKNSTPVRVHKLLAGLSNSVGYVEWDYNGNRGCATCFVLCDGYILTCHHVVRDIAGPGVEEQHWAEISQSVKISFSYENSHPKEDDWFSIEPCLEVSDQALDYAILKLKERSSKFPNGLAKYISSPPYRGLIYIIGHPDGKEKSTDGCSIITPLERGWRCFERLQKRQVEGQQYQLWYHPRSFQEVTANPNVLTYDTSFFCGSSGSPVFDASGRLIAMHTAGYLYSYCKQEHSIVEWGQLIKAILFDIKKKNPEWYKSVLEGHLRDTGGSEDTAEVLQNNREGALSAETNNVKMESDSDLENDNLVAGLIPSPRPIA